MVTDVLIIGAGIAGLKLAYDLSDQRPDLSITILSKSQVKNSNSRKAQGGIAIALGENRKKELHLSDTLSCGIISRKDISKDILYSAENTFRALTNNGLEFDKNPDGSYQLRQEGGHSEKRIFHKSDKTGDHIVQFLIANLIQRENVSFLENTYAYQLNMRNDVCSGVKVINTQNKEIYEFNSRSTILSTGGCGYLYKNTTNSSYAVGNGIALAKEAGASISNMEFIQFHPTVFQDGEDTFLLSEALRGDGAKIVDEHGNPFEEIDELETRDKLSRDLFLLLKNGEDIYLDCSNIPDDKLNNYTFIISKLEKKDIDIKKELLPIRPASHYQCGGIDIDLQGKTSLQNLYAIGEVANSGLHGANRLASNSLTEALTIPYNLSKKLAVNGTGSEKNIETFHKYVEAEKDYNDKADELRKRMWSHCGIIRNYDSLGKMKEHINSELEKMKWQNNQINEYFLEYRNMLICAQEIVDASIRRKENIGTYFNEDLI